MRGRGVQVRGPERSIRPLDGCSEGGAPAAKREGQMLTDKAASGSARHRSTPPARSREAPASARRRSVPSGVPGDQQVVSDIDQVCRPAIDANQMAADRGVLEPVVDLTL